MGVKVKGVNPYDEHLTSTAVHATTTVVKEKKLGGGVKETISDTQETELLNPGMVKPTKSMFMLEVRGGQTVQTMPFESARIDVGLTVPCSKDDLEVAYDWATNWIGEKISAAVKDAKGG